MLQNLSGWHALVILSIVLLVFGSAKLPTLARSVGESMRILKDEVADGARTTGASASDVSATSGTASADTDARPTVTPVVPATAVSQHQAS